VQTDRKNTPGIAGNHNFEFLCRETGKLTVCSSESEAKDVIHRPTLERVAGFSRHPVQAVVLEHVYFGLVILRSVEDLPPGFLFVCPANSFQTGPSSSRWPECATYWSLDPSGVERLSMDDATALGFSSILLSMKIHGRSWDSSVYTGLRQFHQAKGFDPDSQDIARHLCNPLRQMVHLRMVSQPSRGKPCCSTDNNLSPVDDEDYFSDEDNQDLLSMDKSDDI
jgi:hypothetical protein